MLLQRLSEPGNADVNHTLARRGFVEAEQQRLAALLPWAQGSFELPPACPDAEPQEDEQRALYQWLKDWSATAHAVVRQKRYLIQLGLATRRCPGEGEGRSNQASFTSDGTE